MGTWYESGRATPAAGHAAGTKRVSPVLLGGLAIAMIALALAFHASRDADQAGRPDMQLPASSAGGASAFGDAVVNRPPRPLAGNPVPSYPRSALRKGSEGDVVLSIIVGDDGRPVDVQVVERAGTEDPAFDRAAIEAALQWRFEPALHDGEAVPSTVRLPIEFRRN